MNWTGGSLQRYAHGTSESLTAAQRKYFAKTRTQRHSRSGAGWIHQSPEFLVENPEPSIHCLAEDSFQNREADYFPKNDQNDQLSISTPRYLIDGHSQRAISEQGAAQSDEIPLEHPQHNENDCSVFKSHTGSLGVGKAKSKIANDRLSIFKRRLLEQKDWISIEQSKPVEIRFPRTDQTRQFGKRRKVCPTKDIQSKRASTRTLRNQDPFSSADSLVIRVNDQIVNGKALRRHAEGYSSNFRDSKSGYEEKSFNHISNSILHNVALQDELTSLGRTPGFSDEYLDQYGSRKTCSSKATRQSQGEASTNGVLETPDCGPQEPLDSQGLEEIKEALNDGSCRLKVGAVENGQTLDERVAGSLADPSQDDYGSIRVLVASNTSNGSAGSILSLEVSS